MWATQKLYPQAYPGAKFSVKASQWTFPSGARLWLTYLERTEDVLRYQGQAFCWLGWDELTQHPTSFAFDYMRSRLRTTYPTLPLCVRATSNPGGPGHGWVKRTFINPAPVNNPFVARDLETGEEQYYPEGHPNAGQPLFMRKFIPSKLSDNPYLAKDGVYEANLLSLPENQRRQLLEGDWAVATGAAFPEFRTSIHTCEPFEVPTDWKRFRSCDFGCSSFWRSIGLQLILTVEPSTSTESSTCPNTLEGTLPKPLFGQKKATKFPTKSSTVPVGTKEACPDPLSQKK